MKTLINFKIIFFLLIVSYAQAQEPSIAWQKTYAGFDSYANTIKQTNDGGYIVAGPGNIDNTSPHDYLIIKLDAFGNVEWQKFYGGSDEDIACSIDLTFDNGYILAGYSSSSDGDVSGNYGLEDVWIIKLDSLGNLEWEKDYGTTNKDYALSIQQTVDTGYIVTGYTLNYLPPSSEAWTTMKLDAFGNIEWKKDNHIDYPYAIDQTFDGGYVIAGYDWSDTAWVYGKYDYKIVKIDSLGNEQWQKRYGGSQNDYAYSIQQTLDTGYIVAGTAQSRDKFVSNSHDTTDSCYPGDYWILKLNASGDIEWKNCYGGPSADWAFSVVQTIDSGYVIGGIIDDGYSDGYKILKIDALGNIQWQKGIPVNDVSEYFMLYNKDRLMSIQQTSDNGYIIAGGNGAEFLVVKLNADNSGINIHPEENNSFFVYPNPAKDQLQIENVNLTGAGVLKIYTLKGKLIKTVPVAKKIGIKEVNVSDLQNGVYLLSFGNPNSRNCVKFTVLH